MRKDAEAILRAAVEAIEPASLVKRALEKHSALWKEPPRVSLIAFGKAAVGMSYGALAALGRTHLPGVVIAPKGTEHLVHEGFDRYGGGHPLPNSAGMLGSRAALDLARNAGPEDLLVVLVSGGGSSLLALPPPGVSLEELRSLTRILLRSGAPIEELNSVRKQVDLVKGGRLAQAAAPARVLALMISDVVGDAVDQIASGPLHTDHSAPGQAREILERHGLWGQVPRSIRNYIDPGAEADWVRAPAPGDPCFQNVTSVIVGSGRTAAHGACLEARKRGYRTLTVSTTISGEARHVGRFLADAALRIKRQNDPFPPPACIVTAGETTVTIHGDGRGGRNQEVALGAAQELKGVDSVLLASMGTDGVDGPTEAAGAVATGSTLQRASDAGLSYRDALARNDAYPFFKALGDLIVTGPTGTNVADLQIVLVK